MLVKRILVSSLLLSITLGLVGGVGFFSLVGVYSATVDASAADDPAVKELNQQIDAQRSKIDEISKKIDEYRKNIRVVQGQQSTLKNQMSLIDNTIAKTNLDISGKEAEIKGTELEIEKIKLEIKERELLISRDKEKLGAFIRLLSRYDDRSYLSVLLANDSFSEFFDQVKYTESIRTDLQKTLNRVQELVEKLQAQQVEVEKKKQQLDELLERLNEEKVQLDAQKGEKQYLIAETKQSESKFQALIRDLQKEQAAANSAATNLERRLREQLKKKGGDEKFNSLGDAALGWPITSRRITAHFHDSDYPFRKTIGEHSGTDFGIPVGTPIYAAEAGYVAKAAVGTKWYGNYIQIIHSNNLSTLYAHMSSLSVGADQYVSKGQIIGYSGNTGFSSGPHLHFEVRLNGIPVNALNYLP